MKILTKLALLVAFLCSASFADENLPDANQRVSVYLHPVSLIGTMAVSGAPLFLYLTGEVPLSELNSLIINPSLWAGGSDTEFFRIGSGVGMRRFANGKADGFYLQLMGSLHYLKVTEKIIAITSTNWGTDIESHVASSGPLADILGYIGYSAKYSGISAFFDFGIGYGYTNIKGKDPAEDGWNFSAFNGRGLSLDFNIGLGIPF